MGPLPSRTPSPDMSSHFLAAGLEVRVLSAKGGRGVFATRAIQRGELLAVFGGNIVDTQTLARLNPDERAYALQVENDLHLLTSPGQCAGADYINHSCEPNAGLSGAISLVALRQIRAGEEICYDYAMSDSNPFMEFGCSCGSGLCRGTIRHDDWRKTDLHRRYKRAFSPYLLRRIRTETRAANALAIARAPVSPARPASFREGEPTSPR